MKRAFAGLAAAAVIVCGWVFVGTLYSRADASPPPIVLVPIVHEKYDASKIDRSIENHEWLVKQDPVGAIGWELLSGAYLARSRESDMDTFAWKADDAARKSLALRTRGNKAAWTKLVQSLLEQHRFQDALAKTEEGIRFFPDHVPLRRMKADILLEIGKLDEAVAVLARIPLSDGGLESAPISARIASLRGNHEKAIAYYRKAYDILTKYRWVSEADLAWYLTKIGMEQEALRDDVAAKKSYDESLRLYPRSYKAWLGQARVASRAEDYPAVLAASAKTLETAYSLDAIAMRGDAHKAMGKAAEAAKDYDEILKMYRAECQNFDSKGKGGPLHVKPIDRQFATFAATRGMFQAEALPAARRDHANRPDEIAKKNLRTLSK